MCEVGVKWDAYLRAKLDEMEEEPESEKEEREIEERKEYERGYLSDREYVFYDGEDFGTCPHCGRTTKDLTKTYCDECDDECLQYLDINEENQKGRRGKK